MLTEFGKEIRKLRIDKGLRLLDLAERLSMSSAFVSAVETGRKPIPIGYPAMAGAAMGLSREEIERLERAADKAKSQISLENLSSDKRELLAAFARRPDDVPQHLLDELRKAVFKSSGSDIPFQRRRRGILVPLP
jgi:transcriptional regulator with XRE-family HTH domain